MIKMDEVREEHIDDIHGLALMECKENGIPLYITREFIEAAVRYKGEDSFSKVLLLNDVVIGYIFAIKNRILPIVDVEHFFLNKKFLTHASGIELLSLCEQWALSLNTVTITIRGTSIVNRLYAETLGFNACYSYFGKDIYEHPKTN